MCMEKERFLKGSKLQQQLKNNFILRPTRFGLWSSSGQHTTLSKTHLNKIQDKKACLTCDCMHMIDCLLYTYILNVFI